MPWVATGHDSKRTHTNHVRKTKFEKSFVPNFYALGLRFGMKQTGHEHED